jgi:hypothetical protein
MIDETTRTYDVGRINAGADLHATVYKAVVRAFGTGLTRPEITDILMAVVCLLPLDDGSDDEEPQR